MDDSRGVSMDTNEGSEMEEIISETSRPLLFLFTTIINYLGIIIALFGMGCIISIKDFSRKEMHLPQSVMIGLLLQYVIQPFVGYLLAVVLKMGVYDALAMIILSCCPVSSYCAVLVYYGDGFVIVGLCIAMFSTALSVGLMPFYFSFYAKRWTEEYHVIATPREIFIEEILIVIPTAFGVAFKRYAGIKHARLMAKCCSCAFIFSAILGPILNAVDHPDHYVGDWKIWVGAILLPFIGFVSGFFLTLVFRLPYEACSAVSLAVGLPNWYIATSTAWRFFVEDEVAIHGVLTLVSICTITMPVEGFVWSVMYRGVEEVFQRISPQCCKGDDDNDKPQITLEVEGDEETTREV